MALSQKARAADRRTVRDRISDISEKIGDEKEFRACAASTDLDYRMSDARLKGLRAELHALQEILGDL